MMRAAMSTILGGLSPASFLRTYWQKRPLLIRQALPGFPGIVDRDGLFGLATRPDATSRLVIRHPRRRRARQWERHDGPFGAIDASMLPDRHWTLLVHGLESLVPGGWELLRRFDFLPAARIDDLMVSHAADGGTVGPHDDLYDVFLLQGPGRRRWQISNQADRATDPSATLRVLRSFVPEEEWTLEPGDMLYLPPGVAHFGVAVDGPCFTYSIGFLAPTHAELTRHFLEYLGAALSADVDPAARYQDPQLRATEDPVEVSDAMLGQVSAVLRAIRWPPALFADFLGRFLTRTKAWTLFTRPERKPTLGAFARRLRGHGRLSLALPSRGLARRGRIFLNGDAHDVKPAAARLFKQLVRARSLPLPITAGRGMQEILHGWFAAGYVRIDR
jgi:50S ribosomal protein L16 3-hydroxylase